MKRTFQVMALLFVLSCFIVPLKAQNYVFPEWLIDEFFGAGMTDGEWVQGVHYRVTVRGYEFYWYNYDGQTVRFEVDDFGIYYHGDIYGYYDYVLGVDWYALLGVFPGGGITSSTTIVGMAMENFSNMVLSNSSAESYLQQPSLDYGVEYESATYYGAEISGYTIPFQYFRPLSANRGFGLTGKVNISTTENSSKYYLHLSPYWKTRYDNDFTLGYLFDANIMFGSSDNYSPPTVTLFGAGLFVSYDKSLDPFDYTVGLMVQPKYGESSFNLPVAYGFRGSMFLNPTLSPFIEIIMGSDFTTETSQDSFGMLNIGTWVGGSYNLGYKTNLRTADYDNSTLYLNFRRFF